MVSLSLPCFFVYFVRENRKRKEAVGLFAKPSPWKRRGRGWKQKEGFFSPTAPLFWPYSHPGCLLFFSVLSPLLVRSGGEIFQEKKTMWQVFLIMLWVLEYRKYEQEGLQVGRETLSNLLSRARWVSQSILILRSRQIDTDIHCIGDQTRATDFVVRSGPYRNEERQGWR